MARIAVAATAPFGADVLERLAETHDVALLLTRADKPRGRGQKLAPTPAKEVAARLGIPVAQPGRLDEDVEIPTGIVVVAAYGLLIPEPLLSRSLWLNVHPSLLPRWRGAAPVERALISGDARTGVTIHRTTAELDAGPIAAQEAFDLAPDDDAGAVFVRSAEVAARLLDAVIADPHFTEQPAEGVTYAEKLTPEDRELDLSRPAHELVNRVRALSPHIGARAVVGGRPLLVWKARATDDGELELLEVQPEGKRRMSYDEYLRGLR
jgi:methionyl-tRNA formyltransferase